MLIIIDGCCLDAPRQTCKILIIELKQSEDLITKVFGFFQLRANKTYTQYSRKIPLCYFLRKLVSTTCT